MIFEANVITALRYVCLIIINGMSHPFVACLSVCLSSVVCNVGAPYSEGLDFSTIILHHLDLIAYRTIFAT